jgi:histone H3/H4
MSASVDEVLGADVGVEVADDAVDVAEHAGDVLVDVEDAVGARDARQIDLRGS